MQICFADVFRVIYLKIKTLFRALHYNKIKKKREITKGTFKKRIFD